MMRNEPSFNPNKGSTFVSDATQDNDDDIVSDLSSLVSKDLSCFFQKTTTAPKPSPKRKTEKPQGEEASEAEESEEIKCIEHPVRGMTFLEMLEANNRIIQGYKRRVAKGESRPLEPWELPTLLPTIAIERVAEQKTADDEVAVPSTPLKDSPPESTPTSKEASTVSTSAAAPLALPPVSPVVSFVASTPSPKKQFGTTLFFLGEPDEMVLRKVGKREFPIQEIAVPAAVQTLDVDTDGVETNVEVKQEEDHAFAVANTDKATSAMSSALPSGNTAISSSVKSDLTAQVQQRPLLQNKIDPLSKHIIQTTPPKLQLDLSSTSIFLDAATTTSPSRRVSTRVNGSPRVKPDQSSTKRLSKPSRPHAIVSGPNESGPRTQYSKRPNLTRKYSPNRLPTVGSKTRMPSPAKAKTSYKIETDQNNHKSASKSSPSVLDSGVGTDNLLTDQAMPLETRFSVKNNSPSETQLWEPTARKRISASDSLITSPASPCSGENTHLNDKIHATAETKKLSIPECIIPKASIPSITQDPVQKAGSQSKDMQYVSSVLVSSLSGNDDTGRLTTVKTDNPAKREMKEEAVTGSQARDDSIHHRMMKNNVSPNVEPLVIVETLNSPESCVDPRTPSVESEILRTYNEPSLNQRYFQSEYDDGLPSSESTRVRISPLSVNNVNKVEPEEEHGLDGAGPDIEMPSSVETSVQACSPNILNREESLQVPSCMPLKEEPSSFLSIAGILHTIGVQPRETWAKKEELNLETDILPEADIEKSFHSYDTVDFDDGFHSESCYVQFDPSHRDAVQVHDAESLEVQKQCAEAKSTHKKSSAIGVCKNTAKASSDAADSICSPQNDFETPCSMSNGGNNLTTGPLKQCVEFKKHFLTALLFCPAITLILTLSLLFR